MDQLRRTKKTGGKIYKTENREDGVGREDVRNYGQQNLMYFLNKREDTA